MARILISLAGEGRGHATRVRSYVEFLRHEHEIVLFAPDEAYDFLAKYYGPQTPEVRLFRIPGLRFHYVGNRLNYSKTLTCAARYLWRDFGALVHRFEHFIRDERADLVITDFEPALPRAAKRCGVPFLTLDHQHFLVVNDLSSLPLRLRLHAWLGRLTVRAYHTGQAETIVSSFFHRPRRRGHEQATTVGPMLRPEVRGIETTDGGYVLSYLRKNTPSHIIDVLKGCGRPVRVYGLGVRPPEGNVTFCAIDEHQFVVDLAGCSALVGAAGNQLLGEAVYLGKPVLAIPESNLHEQMMNAHFLKEMGCGDWIALEKVTATDLRDFLARLDSFRPVLQKHGGVWDGVPAALEAIRRHLPAAPVHARREMESSVPPRPAAMAS